MSKIFAVNDLSTNGWTVTLDAIASTYADLHVGFTGTGIEFSQLEFGYELRQGASVIQSKQWPPPNVVYKRTDQQYIAFDRLNFQDGQTYSLMLWMDVNGERFENITEFTSPVITGKPLTHLQFIERFTLEEQATFETLLADCRNGTSTLDAATRGQVLVMGRQFEAAQDVRLDNPSTVQFVNALVAMGILTQSRADEILAP